MVRASVALVVTGLVAVGCKKEEEAAPEAAEPAAARATEPKSEEPETEEPEEPEAEEPEATIVSVDRMYSSKGDQRPVQVELTLPPGWAQESGRGGRARLRPEGGKRWPSLSVYIIMDHQDDAREAIRQRVEEKRTRQPADEVITVVDERELEQGGTLLARRVDAREAKRKVHYFEVLCFLNRSGDPYVVMLQATAYPEEEDTGLPEFAEICAAARVLGPADE
jgi:hypothetical protein